MARKNADLIKLEMAPVREVTAYTGNAKIHPDVQIDRIMASIRQFGFVSPILLDAEGVIVAGHGRLLAAQRMSMEYVPVIRLGHLSPEQAKALRIADNSLAESGTRWDIDLLEKELSELRELKFDLESIGLEDIQLPELEEIEPNKPRANRSKTTLFISIANPQVDQARKVIAAALDKAKIGHNL